MPALEIVIEAIDRTKAAFRNIESNINRLQSSFKSQISKSEKVFNKLANSIGSLSLDINSALGGVSSALSNLGPAGIAAGAGIAALGYTITDSVNVARDFEQAVTNAAIVTGKMGVELDKAKESIRAVAQELGRTTVFSAREASNAIYLIASAGIDVSEMSAKDLAPALNLAAATMSDLTSTLDTLLATSTIFNIKFNESGKIADIFTKAISSSQATLDKLSYSLRYAGPIAASLNYTVEDTVAILSKLYDAGFKGEQAGTILRGALSRLLDPTNEVIDTLSELNIQIYTNSEEIIRLYREYQNAQARLDQLKSSSKATKNEIKAQRELVKATKKAYQDAAKGGLKPFIEILRELEKAGVDAETMIKIFGVEAGPGMMALLKQGSSSLQELTNELKNAADTAKSAAEEQLDTFEGRMKLLHSAVEGLKISVGMALIPALTKFVEIITFLLKPFSALMGAIWQGIKNTFSPLKDIIQTLSNIFAQAGLSNIQFGSTLELVTKAVEISLIKFRILLEIISLLLKVLTPVLIPALQGLKAVIDLVIQGLTYLNNIINQLIATLQNLYNWITNIISGSGFVELNNIIITIQSTINSLISILSLLETSFLNVKSTISSVVSEVYNLISAIANIPRNITISVTRTITEVTKKIIEKIPSLQKGGIIKKEGIYYLHKGEEVISTKEKRSESRLPSQTKIVNFNFDKIYLSEKYTLKNLEDDMIREYSRGL